MEAIKEYKKLFDDSLQKKNAFTDVLAIAEKKTGVARSHLVYGFIGFLAIYLMIGYGSHFLCNFIGFLYPAYKSIKAVESSQKDDDTQWLTYWVVYAAFSIIEVFFDIFLFWIPFYAFIKCLLLIFMMAPIENNGAVLAYNRLLKPFVLKYESQIDATMNRAADLAGNVTQDLKKKGMEAAGNYMSKKD